MFRSFLPIPMAAALGTACPAMASQPEPEGVPRFGVDVRFFGKVTVGEPLRLWVAMSGASVRATGLTALLFIGLAPRSEGQQVEKTICILVDRAWVDDAFLRGLRRTFVQRNLPLEQEGPKGHWCDAGTIRNTLHVVASCVDERLADSLQALRLGIDSARDQPDAVDYVVRLRIKGWSQAYVRYMNRPGDPPPTPEDLIDPNGVTVEVAMCAPESLTATSSLAWTPMRVWWREKPSSPSRAQEIHGWVVGMAALQIVHRRLGLLPDSLDLVSESRGRNR